MASHLLLCECRAFVVGLLLGVFHELIALPSPPLLSLVAQF